MHNNLSANTFHPYLYYTEEVVDVCRDFWEEKRIEIGVRSDFSQRLRYRVVYQIWILGNRLPSQSNQFI